MDRVYTVYKIKNRINKKVYIGVHLTSNIHDDYFGSGDLINKSIKKHGKHNFYKIILFITEHKSQAYKLEKLLVTQSLINSRQTYNMKPGGVEGRGCTHTEEEKQNTSDRMKINNPAFNMTEETKLKMSISHTGKPSHAKGKIKIAGDGRFEGCSHKGEQNPRSKTFILTDPNGTQYTINLSSNLKIFCIDNNLDFYALDITLSKKSSNIDSNYYKEAKNITTEMKLKRENTVGWCVSVYLTKDFDVIANK